MRDFLIVHTSGNLTMNHSQGFQNQSWRLIPKLDMPELFPPAVMFSVLDSDPHSTYESALQKSRTAIDGRGFQPPPPLTSAQMQQLTLRAAWDSVFHDVPGDRIGLLIQNAVSHTAAPDTDTPQFAVLIGSTEPPGSKWIATRATQHNGKTVCWCLPVEVSTGKTTEVVLTAQNMTTLDSE
jgi:hypothetical protein